MSAVLMVGAHFDDVEIGCAGALMHHRSRGQRVVIYVASPSNYDHWALGLQRSAEAALSEGQRAARYLDADLIVGDFPTKSIQNGPQLIESIERVITEYRVETVYTHWLDDVHQDHRAVAQATLSAARNVPTVLMYRSNWYTSPRPWSPNVFVDVTPWMEHKEASIRCHTTEVTRRGEDWIAHWRSVSAVAGRSVGVRYAESFKAVKLLLA